MTSFLCRTGYGNRTHIARLRILSTNRYTNPAVSFVSFEQLVPLFGIAKVGIFPYNPNFFRNFCATFFAVCLTENIML